MNPSTQEEDLVMIADQCQRAVEKIFAAMDVINGYADRLKQNDPELSLQLKSASLTVVEACSFQDLVGQLVGRLRHGASEDPLLQGPARDATGPSQADIDLLWANSLAGEA